MIADRVKIHDTTLLCIDSKPDWVLGLASVHFCMSQCDFTQVKFLTHYPLKLRGGAEAILIDPIQGRMGTNGYSRFCVKELYKYIDTKYVLIVQWDGHIINREEWRDEFYEYDYIGAKWWPNYPGVPCTYNIGNGGFSFRTKKILEVYAKDERMTFTDPEDAALGRNGRAILEHDYGIKYAPEELADRFSWDAIAVPHKTFGFHSRVNYYNEYKEKYGLPTPRSEWEWTIGPAVYSIER